MMLVSSAHVPYSAYTIVLCRYDETRHVQRFTNTDLSTGKLGSVGCESPFSLITENRHLIWLALVANFFTQHHQFRLCYRQHWEALEDDFCRGFLGHFWSPCHLLRPSQSSRRIEVS